MHGNRKRQWNISKQMLRVSYFFWGPAWIVEGVVGSRFQNQLFITRFHCKWGSSCIFKVAFPTYLNTPRELGYLSSCKACLKFTFVNTGSVDLILLRTLVGQNLHTKISTQIRKYPRDKIFLCRTDCCLILWWRSIL